MAQTNEYFQRIYTSLPTHTVIYYTMTIWAIDTWQDSRGSADNFKFVFDLTTIQGFQNLDQGKFYEMLGGIISFDERNIQAYGTVTHTAASLTFKIISLLQRPSYNSSIGFREIDLNFVNVASPPANTLCGWGPGPATFTQQCNCAPGYYLLSLTCTPCAAGCSSCFGGSASQCYQCAPGYSYVGTTCTACYAGCSVCHGTAYNQCDECVKGFFLYNSNQCQATCDLPLLQNSTGCRDKCYSPCNSTAFLYWDSSCASTCPYPLKQGLLFDTIPTCNSPCSTTDYLTDSGACTSTCTSPLLIKETKERFLCTSPCSAGQYLYWNGTCSSLCTYPLTITVRKSRLLTCVYPCTLGQYLYWNGSCLASCASNLNTRNENGYLFCDYPLQDVTMYLNWDSTGSYTCAAPYIPRVEGSPMIRNFCDFKCSAGTYLHSNGLCVTTCNYPLVPSTSQGASFCTNPCTTSQYLSYTGDCLTSCPSTGTARSEGGYLYCDFKCTGSSFLYWDNTCSASCLQPLTQYYASNNLERRCLYGCSASQYLYWNGSCSDSCALPLTSSVFKTKNFCNYKCNANEFLYYNGTCAKNCVAPLVERRVNEDGFCDFPCSSTEFLFWNGTCIPSCDVPLIQSFGTYGESYCGLPCHSALQYYDLETGTCVASCSDSSLIVEGLFLVCLPVNQAAAAAAAEVAEAEAPNGLIGFILYASVPGTVSFITPVRLTQYVKFLGITHTARFRLFATTSARSFLSLRLTPPMSHAMRSKITKRPLPRAFYRTDIHSNFVVNYWQDLTTLAIFLACTIVSTIISKCVNKASGPHSTVDTLTQKLHMILKWNLIMIMIASTIDNIILYSAIDFMTMSLHSSSATLSLFIMLIMMGLAIFVLFQIYSRSKKHYIARQEALSNNDIDSYIDYLTKWRSWHVLFRGFNEKQKITQMFYFIYIIRISIPSILCVAFRNLPITQTVFQLAVSILILSFILTKSPIKRRINRIQLVTIETLVLIINFAAFLLATYDATPKVSIHSYILTADLIIFLNVVINIIMVVFLVLKIAFEAREIYLFQEGRLDGGMSLYISRLFVIFIQQSVFGFEEILENLRETRDELEQQYPKQVAKPYVDNLEKLQLIDEEINKSPLFLPTRLDLHGGEPAEGDRTANNEENDNIVKGRLERLRGYRKQELDSPERANDLEKQDEERSSSPIKITDISQDLRASNGFNESPGLIRFKKPEPQEGSLIDQDASSASYGKRTLIRANLKDRSRVGAASRHQIGEELDASRGSRQQTNLMSMFMKNE